jgi:Rha family phage regulatory protein
MNFLPTLDPSAISIKNNHATTTSLTVAKMFGKQHKDILKKLKTIECSDEFRSANFCAHPYTNSQNGETYIQYDITKDGFVFLVMGFTGKKAAHMKEAYINAFNKMEAEFAQRQALQGNPYSLQAPPTQTQILLTLQAGIVINTQRVPSDSIVVPPSDIPRLIRDGEYVSIYNLPAIIQAATETILKRSTLN